MEQFLALAEAYRESDWAYWVSLASSTFWLTMYIRLRNQVKKSELEKSEYLQKAIDDANDKSRGKLNCTFSLGVCRGLTVTKNIVLKGSKDNG